VKEDAVRGARKGGIAGALGALALTVLTVPALGPLAVSGPIVSVLCGAVARGGVGGLAGGSGGLTPIRISPHETPRMEQKLHNGAILIAVHSSDPVRRDRAIRVFKSAGAEDVYGSEDVAA